MIVMLLGALIFVAIGLWFVISPPSIKNSFWGNPTKIAIAGYASIIFFGLCSFFLIRKMFDAKIGLIIDNTGITDNSSGLSAGHIPWLDIEKISVIEIHRQKLILIHVKNPHHYIDKQTSFLKRKSMELSNKMYQTPLSITTNGLKISFDKLFAFITKRFEKQNVRK
jgi:hypothetical protein